MQEPTGVKDFLQFVLTPTMKPTYNIHFAFAIGNYLVIIRTLPI